MRGGGLIKMGIIQSWLHRLKGLSYDTQKQLAQSGTVKQRSSLAKSSHTNREILFYLAQHDPESKIRQQVAKNSSTPLHANEVLSRDNNQDVRLALCGRLVALLPELSIDKQSQLYAFTVQALGTLALDEVLKIRKSLAVTLKDHAYAPPTVAAQLAQDIEREVAEPILRFCVALKDNDLIDIVRTHPQHWAAEAVARRPSLSALLSKAVIGTNNAKAGKYLIENKGAVIDQNLLYDIIVRAKEFPEWHEPLALHHKLSPDMARSLARYTDARIRKLLQEKSGYDLTDTENVVDATRRRINLEEQIKERSPEELKITIQKLLTDNKLDEDVMLDHLALRDVDFIAEVLKIRFNLNDKRLKNILALKKAEIICALCWKMGYSMRLASRLQQDYAGISNKELLVAKHGTDYPLPESKMQWHLDYLDIK